MAIFNSYVSHYQRVYIDSINFPQKKWKNHEKPINLTKQHHQNRMLILQNPQKSMGPRHPAIRETETFLGCGYCHEAFPEKRELQEALGHPGTVVFGRKII